MLLPIEKKRVKRNMNGTIARRRKREQVGFSSLSIFKVTKEHPVATRPVAEEPKSLAV